MRAGVIMRCLVTFCAVLMLCAAWAIGGEVTLKDGTRLKGKSPVPLDTVGVRSSRPDPKDSPNLAILMIEEAGAVQFFVPKRFAKEINPEVDLRPSEVFKLPTEHLPKHRLIKEVGGQLVEKPWDEHGHRMAIFNSNGKEVDVMQEIVELNPKYFKVTAMKYLWEFGLPTNSIPPETLDQILHRAIKKNDPDERFAIARFYLDGEFYPLAQKELDSIRADYPDRAEQVAELSAQLKNFLADQAVRMLEERRGAGQYQFAYDTAKKFLSLDIPEIREGTLQTLRKGLAKADEERTKMEDARQLLGQLQAQLSKEQAAEVAPLRVAISEGLHPDTLDRLAPFLLLAGAPDQKPEEQLALALSGWVIGAAQADTDLKNALRLWQARGMLIEYFRADNPSDRAAIVDKLRQTEGIGPRQVSWLIPLLPPQLEIPDHSPGKPFVVDARRRTDADPEVQYTVLLPPEYHSERSYPVVVALHAAGMTPEQETRWWARQAQRFGYIVLAPRFAELKQQSYDYDLESHTAVLETVKDARRRFNIDSDRVFLGGHGMGADAVLDIGYSHPDIFAGIMPITGMMDRSTHFYRENAKQLPQYIIAGQLDRQGLEQNSQDIDRMMQQAYPLIYAVFIGRGYESYQSEDGRLFEWMSRQRRLKPPLEIDMKTGRTTDNHFWWWTFSNFPAKFGVVGWPKDERGPNAKRPVVLGATARRAKGANVINLDCPAQWHGIWLYPEVVSFDKRLIIRQSGHQWYNEIPEADISAMLEDHRLRADRQQIAWGYLEVGKKAIRPTTTATANRTQRISSKSK